MAQHKPLMESLLGNKKEKSSALTSKIKKEKEKIKEERERQEEISKAFTDVKITLKTVGAKYQDVFEKELRTARRNAHEGVKDRSNYSRIGVAYYSKQVINAAERRLEDLHSDFEIKSAMTELTSTLKLINEMPKVIGKLNTSGVIKEGNRMENAASSSGGDLVNSLKKLSNLQLDGVDTRSIENIVSKDEIEKWIDDDDYAEQCFKKGSKKQTSGDDLLAAGSEIYRNLEEKNTEVDSLAALKALADSL